jgi:hypothetical protein
MAYVHKTETHHESGFSFRIVQDSSYTESPIDGDESVAFFVFHHRYRNPSQSLARGACPISI